VQKWQSVSFWPLGSSCVKAACEMDTCSQFHQRIMSSFYSHRSQKCKNYSKVVRFFSTFGIYALKIFLKLTPVPGSVGPLFHTLVVVSKISTELSPPPTTTMLKSSLFSLLRIRPQWWSNRFISIEGPWTHSGFPWPIFNYERYDVG